MIGLYNLVDKDLYGSLSTLKTIQLKNNTKFPNLKGLFIDWIDTSNKKKPSKDYAYQAALISYYSKKNIPLVIFDRYMCITSKEYKWLRKFNTYLYEPALNYRRGFEYQPYWIYIDEERIFSFEDDEREYTLGHTGQMYDSLEKYYKNFEGLYPDTTIQYNVDDWKNVNYMIAIDSKKNYDIGHLNMNVINALQDGCMVLCPIEHKYYSNLFQGNTVEDIGSIMYWTYNYTQMMRVDAILGVYKTIEERYSEFTIKQTVENMFGVFK
jgi:hypothetical protein